MRPLRSRAGILHAVVMPEEQYVVYLERLLLDPEVRHDPGGVAALIDDDFVEFGASGRRWDKAAVVAALPREPMTNEPLEMTSEQVTTLGADIVLLTYRAGGALRSSIWRRGSDGMWRVGFTRAPSTDA